MKGFKQSLLKFIGPRLSLRGYNYEESLRDRDLIYGFHKNLADDIQAVIIFQRSVDDDESPVGSRFVVDLIRCKTTHLEPFPRGGYEGYLKFRLGQLMWFFYGLRIYSSYEHWWSETPEGLKEAIDKLERYAIPWLDDPQSRVVGWLNFTEWRQFGEMLSVNVGPELISLGYQVREEPERKLHSYGVKSVGNDLQAFVIFNPIAFRDTLGFDILLFRKRSTDPFDENWVADDDCFEVWASKLLPQKYNIQISSQSPGVWRYTNQIELRDQLNDALAKLKKYALPWLEDPHSRQFE